MKRRQLNSFGFHIFSMLLALAMFYPIMWLAMSSFKADTEIFQSGLRLIPDKPTLENYLEAWNGFGRYKFPHFLWNSLCIAVPSTLGVVFSSSLVGFGFARIPFKGSRFLFTCMIITIMLPYQIIMVPQYVIFNQLRWINTFLPLVVPAFLGDAFLVFLVIQFIRTIPKELDESATIDGCSVYRVFSSIILPLLKAPLITVAIFKFYWSWEDLLQPMIYLNKIQLYPLSVALSMWADPMASTKWGALLAMGFLSLVPVMLVFAFLQRYIVDGVSTQGLKG